MGFLGLLCGRSISIGLLSSSQGGCYEMSFVRYVDRRGGRCASGHGVINIDNAVEGTRVLISGRLSDPWSMGSSWEEWRRSFVLVVNKKS